MSQVKEGTEVEAPPEFNSQPVRVDGAEAPLTAQELFAAVRGSGLIGMWKKRKDIGDSSEYARELRRRAQERQW